MISIKNVSKHFGENQVLDQLSLEVPGNATTVILGRSGQGKSVLLKHIVGLLKPDAGEITVLGQEVTHLSEEALGRVRRHCGLLFQDAALFDSMDVYENIAFPLHEHTELDEVQIAEKVTTALSWVGLEGIEERSPDELSGGMRKRVGLARALILEPKVMLYDEPTTGLDPITSKQINRLIVDTQKRLGMTVMVISHDLESTHIIADKVAMLDEGRIIEEGNVKSFFNSKNERVQRFLKGEGQD